MNQYIWPVSKKKERKRCCWSDLADKSVSMWASYSDHSVWRLPPTACPSDLWDKHGAGWLVWSFQSPERESLESCCSSGNCRVSLVYRAIQRWLWNRAGPWKYSRWKQDREEEGESRRELGAARLISTIPEVRGRGRVGFPLVMSSNCSHLWLGPYRDWRGTAGVSLSEWPSNHEAAGLPPKGHSELLDHTEKEEQR